LFLRIPLRQGRKKMKFQSKREFLFGAYGIDFPFVRSARLSPTFRIFATHFIVGWRVDFKQKNTVWGVGWSTKFRSACCLPLPFFTRGAFPAFGPRQLFFPRVSVHFWAKFFFLMAFSGLLYSKWGERDNPPGHLVPPLAGRPVCLQGKGTA